MAQEQKSKKALLIVDIQDDFTSSTAKMPVNKEQAFNMINNLNRITAQANEKGLTVVYIGNEYTKSDFLNLFRNFAAIKGTAGTKMDDRLKVVTNHYFSKNKGNAFVNSKLDEFLKSQGITDIYVSGLKAEACVYLTTKGAIKNGYKTFVLTDCIATKSDKTKSKMATKYISAGAKTISSDQIYF